MTHLEVELGPQEEKDFTTSIHRYRSGEPMPYILGWWEFYGRQFNVNESVLIPRPETELLVELALHFLQATNKKRTAMDIGTGSGCIAVSLLAEVEDLRVTALDISRNALILARENAVKFRVDSRLQLIQMDLATAIAIPYDLICANLPYIPTSSLENLKVSQSEPLVALDGGDDGLLFIRSLLKDIPRLLLPGGYALIEIEAGTGAIALQSAQTFIPNADCELFQDLAGHDRVLAIEYKGP